jgi:uncharacterized membrane protein YdfJ with MMPL/SSD domain
MADKSNGSSGSSQGPATDRTNQPVQDPTPNVLDLVAAAIERQDDLRNSQVEHFHEISSIRHQYEKQLRSADRFQANLRAAYEEKLRKKETDRIDAIRSVDVGAAAILANQVAASAEALRGQVEAARQQTATALAAALEPIQKDIQDLRRAQYETQGQKTQVVESGSDARDTNALEAVRIQAAQARMQMYALVFAAIVVALGVYAAFHH